MATSLRLLAIRSRTWEEIRRHLSSRRFGKDAIDRTLGTLERLGYINDETLAMRYAAWALVRRPMARVRLVTELVRRGVDRNTIERALDESWGAEEEEAALERAIARATRGLHHPIDRRQRMRVMSYLRRRGFSSSQALAAINSWCSSLAEQLQDDEVEDVDE